MPKYNLPEDLQQISDKLAYHKPYDLRQIHKRLLELKMDYDLAFLVVIFYSQDNYQVHWEIKDGNINPLIFKKHELAKI